MFSTLMGFVRLDGVYVETRHFGALSGEQLDPPEFVSAWSWLRFLLEHAALRCCVSLRVSQFGLCHVRMSDLLAWRGSVF